MDVPLSNKIKFSSLKLPSIQKLSEELSKLNFRFVHLPLPSTSALDSTPEPSSTLSQVNKNSQSTEIQSQPLRKLSDFNQEWEKMSAVKSNSPLLPTQAVQASITKDSSFNENPRLKAVQVWINQFFAKNSSPIDSKPLALSEQDQQAYYRLQKVRKVVNKIEEVFNIVWHLCRPRSSWKCKAPYLEPRAEFLCYGLKWPEEYKFSSEEEQKKFLKSCRKQKDFLYSHLTLWTSIVANLFFIAYVVYDPALPWRNDW